VSSFYFEELMMTPEKSPTLGLVEGIPSLPQGMISLQALSLPRAGSNDAPWYLHGRMIRFPGYIDREERTNRKHHCTTEYCGQFCHFTQLRKDIKGCQEWSKS